MRREQDWWEIRDFLVEIFSIAPPGHVWDVRRWDGHRFHRTEPLAQPFDGRTRIWRNGGRIVAVAHQEGSRDLSLQVHPGYRDLESEMLAWAEDHLASETADGRVLDIHVFDYDVARRRILSERGFEPTVEGEVVRRLWLGGREVVSPRLPAGYRIRTARPDDPQDAADFAALLNAAFGRTWHCGEEVQSFRRCSPSYRADLDLMAEASDGSLAASVGVTLDGVNLAGTLEPVLTHPDHRRLGLSTALITEGIRILIAAGARTAWVGTGRLLEANLLYDTVGFTEAFAGRFW